LLTSWSPTVSPLTIDASYANISGKLPHHIQATVNRDAVIELLDRLHNAQNKFYAGGPRSSFAQILAPSITWTIPGSNGIAGTYHGLEEVIDYFCRRRDISDRTFRLHRRDVLVGDGNRIAALVDGVATIGNVVHHWSTVGLYEVAGQQILACWLLPLDQSGFDAIWAAPNDPKLAQPSVATNEPLGMLEPSYIFDGTGRG
jgi:hypothetical protein